MQFVYLDCLPMALLRRADRREPRRASPVDRTWVTTALDHSFVHTRLDSDWVAFHRIVEQNGAPVVAEIRVVSRSVADAWGEEGPPDWRTSLRVSVPSKGLKFRHLRQLTVHGHLADEVAYRWWLRHEAVSLRAHAHGETFVTADLSVSPPTTVTRGRPRLTDGELLRLAVDYVALVERREPRLIERLAATPVEAACGAQPHQHGANTGKGATHEGASRQARRRSHGPCAITPQRTTSRTRVTGSFGTGRFRKALNGATV